MHAGSSNCARCMPDMRGPPSQLSGTGFSNRFYANLAHKTLRMASRGEQMLDALIWPFCSATNAEYRVATRGIYYNA
eukprot:CAMPEP_0203852900 /NCGR_PEP_ID=MMETSP0359-20131031/8208_1 /ASSEMBLY_ACC=CAM_ASM_000338 /TAXON_ID=268821 /ORGANISM="Scrippsiella Hangoei, Strain SHTV-5" /LENGTH=76 /DNA_ID=CAMNT_0050769149 /DNA_START=24 /DNA_END=250 /DNA_ORIENTATION=+